MENSFNLKKFLAEGKMLKENLNPLQPIYKDEEMLSSPIISKDTQGRDIKLIGKENEKIFWSDKGVRYSKINSNMYQPYQMDRAGLVNYHKKQIKTSMRMNNSYIQNFTPKQDGIDEALSLDPSSPQISQYWDIMVKNQPEDVIQTLTDLTAGRLSFKDFLDTTESDIYDSFSDDDMEDDY